MFLDLAYCSVYNTNRKYFAQNWKLGKKFLISKIFLSVENDSPDAQKAYLRPPAEKIRR